MDIAYQVLGDGLTDLLVLALVSVGWIEVIFGAARRGGYRA
jgi:hypothetical protein